MPAFRRSFVGIVGLLTLTGPCAAETQTLLVPIAPILRGEVIPENALREKSFILNAAQSANWVSSISEVSGKEAKRTLAAGKPIPLNALKAPDVVKRGQLARAVYRTQGLEITTSLTPLEDAPAGAIVRARNPETGITVEALVAPGGELLVEAN